MSMSDAGSHSWLWTFRGRAMDLRTKTLVMGILNVTADSFSDGGRFLSPKAAIAQAESLVADGADIVDIGAESSRPGTDPGPDAAAEEWQRLEPVLVAVRAAHPDLIISVDTYRGETARRALEAGADVINDIYALQHSPEIAAHCAAYNAGLILMHMQGNPATMQLNPSYENVLAEIRTMLRTAMESAAAVGLNEGAIVVDPGIGFGKTVDHNLEILAGLEYLRLLQRPICVGASRKSFLGAVAGGLGVENREEVTIAAHCAAVLQGATIIRTHDVKAAVRSLAVIDAIRNKMEI